MEDGVWTGGCLWLLNSAGEWSTVSLSARAEDNYIPALYVMVQVCDVEPLMNVSKDLKSILTGVCWLLEIQELVSEVRNGSDLHTILEHNILDSCKWVC